MTDQITTVLSEGIRATIQEKDPEAFQNAAIEAYRIRTGGRIVSADGPMISAQCVRVPVSDGHMAAVSVAFNRKPTIEQIREQWDAFVGSPRAVNLPYSADPFLAYSDEDDRPQTRIDRDASRGMGVTLGRLRDDPVLDYKFVALSHNTIRGAAGGSILMAELLKAEGYLNAK